VLFNKYLDGDNEKTYQDYQDYQDWNKSNSSKKKGMWCDFKFRK